MIDIIKNNLRKNKLFYGFLQKVKVLAVLVNIYFLQLFNFMRKSNCTKESIRCEYDFRNKHYKYTLVGKDTPVCCLTHLYEITRDITMLLNQENIEYFIMYGTLLGQVRHNETFIPWDTDVDIVVMKTDQEKVTKILCEEFSNKYDIVKEEKIVKINFSKLNQLHADIYFWEEHDTILIDTLNDYWIKNRLLREDVFPLAFGKLYDLRVKVPKNSKTVLKETYGEDCLETAFKKYAFKQTTLKKFEDGKINEI